jgi:proline dehydrogenase
MITGLLNKALITTMPFVPQPLIWQFSRRYIAGTELADAFRTVRTLNEAGCSTTIDVLGEDSTSHEQIDAARDLYLEALDGIGKQSLDCYASVKLSEMGLRFDVDRCVEVMEALLDKAAEVGDFVRIDMEDSSVTSITLDIYQKLRKKHDNIGAVIQSCLQRSEQDVADLLRSGPTDIRLCKGIYVEPASIAFEGPDEVRSSFCRLLEQLVDGGATRVGIATHDPILVQFAEELIEKRQLDNSRYEFQMLLGVAEKLRTRLVSQGHPLRVYVPFGKLWFNYSLRRLRENPQIAGHIMRNLFSHQ